MNSKKVFPKKSCIRKKSKLACAAIHDLSTLGMQVLNVNFISPSPEIEVYNCTANKQIRSHLTGQGVNEDGNKYVTKSSVFCGCHVFWQEVQHG